MDAMLGYVGLGSNVGDREGHLRAGLVAMAREGVLPVAVSSVYETEPVDGAGPGWFLNMAARVDTSLTPEAVLAALLSIERERGRTRGRPNAPRELDLDLLTLGTMRRRTDELTLPHPRHLARRFVLAPLAELSAEFAEALAALDDPHEVVRLGMLALPETLSVYSRAL
jgi:2-amino-4-hydroxy-6-hydroxymethyldihydropteridine diphosphokinase